MPRKIIEQNERDEAGLTKAISFKLPRGLWSRYSLDELELLGGGDLYLGIERVKKFLRTVPENEVAGAGFRPFNDEIRALHETPGKSNKERG